jgi:hypothetical protein
MHACKCLPLYLVLPSFVSGLLLYLVDPLGTVLKSVVTVHDLVSMKCQSKSQKKGKGNKTHSLV